MKRWESRKSIIAENCGIIKKAVLVIRYITLFIFIPTNKPKHLLILS